MRRKFTYYRILFCLMCMCVIFFDEIMANSGSQVSEDGSFTLVWYNYNSTISATTQGASVTLSMTGPNYVDNVNLVVGIGGNMVSYEDIDCGGMAIGHVQTNVEYPTGSWHNNVEVLQYAISGSSSVTFSFKNNVVYACTGASPCVSFGPDVPDVADGASSVCLNNDAARGTIVKPTVAGVAEGNQGWMIDGVEVSITNIGEYLLTNMSSLDGKTLKYWAKDAEGNPGYSNEVALNVCLPEVGSINNTGTKSGVTFICLNSLLLSKPSVTGSYVTDGWEILENNSSTRFVRVDGGLGNQKFVDEEGGEISLGTFYGKDVRYFAADAYGNEAYSNVVTLMSQPTVTIDLEGTYTTRKWDVCDGEQISEFPSVSYSMNGTTLSSANWYVWNTAKSGGAGWDKYGSQVVSSGGPYTRIYYAVSSVGSMCSSASVYDSRTDLRFKSTETNIKFTPSLEDSYLCSKHAVANVTDLSGNMVDGTVYWTRNNVYIGKTEGNTYDFAFDCEEGLGNVTLGAYVKDPVTGCKSAVSQVVNVNSSFTTYIYNGPTGASSDVTNTNNWILEGNPSVHPSNFTSNDCRYIINTNNVELRSGQTWTVSGEGTKIVIGDGTWNSLSGRSGTGLNSAFTVQGANAGYGVPSGSFELMGQCTNESWITNISNVAKYDYRSYAKTFTITGTFNTEDDVVVDVKSGSSLTINTDAGNFKLGNLAQDKVASSAPILSDGVVNGYSWAAIVPGSSVSYTGTGCSKIRSGKYSQLYIANENVSFEDNAVVEIAQSFASAQTDDAKINPNGSTIKYIGVVNQNIARFNYYNLVLGNASVKSIGGSTRVWIRNSLVVEASTTLKLEEYVSGGSIKAAIVGLYGSGTSAFINNGHVECGPNTTVSYYSSSPTTIAPVYYGNLNLSTKKRTFSSEGVTGISGSLMLGNATCTTTGSIIEFNGTGAQTIPALEYYNLTINNSGLDGAGNYQVSLGGDVIVNNRLSLVEGILNTNGHTLSVTNTSAGAVGQGYRISADSASYVIGNITRCVASNLDGSSIDSYLYPVGTADAYMPLSLSKLTTGSNASVTVGTTNTVAGTSVINPLTSVNTASYWQISGTNYTSSSVSVTSSNGLFSCNTLGFEPDGSSSFENIVGCSVSENSICASSIVEGNGTVALANRTINARTYYLNCNNTNVDASNINSWYTERYKLGDHPSSFFEDDATWIIDCGKSFKKDLTIGGSNTKVYFNIRPNDILTIDANVTLPIVEFQQGNVEITRNGSLTVLNSFTMADVATATQGDWSSAAVAKRGNRTKLNNHGTLNVYNSDLNITNGYVVNDGVMIFNNTDVSIASSLNQGPDYSDLNTTERHSRFINQGEIRMINCNLTVSGRQVYVKNEDGAVWLVDNTASPSKKVVFGAGNASGVEFMDDPYDMKFIYFECGSSFVTKHADVEVLYQGDNDGCTAYLEGELAVYDGNLLVRRKGQGGGNFTIKSCGAVYMIDTDDSGDGIFMVDGTSGWQVNVEGSLYAVGILNRSDGSGNKFNVKDGAQIFVGDIGVTSSSSHSWDFSLDVKSGGTMNYCGNRTSGSDALGKNEGTLNYAGSFYQNSSPATQGDVGGTGSENVLYADGTECMADYEETVYGNQGSILLPVELTMLYGICKNGNVELHWQTASESNNEGFVILRSFDGVNFEEIAEVMGAGTSTGTINYMYVDEEDKTGMVYYKLRQVDFDGKTKESKIVAVQTCGPNARFAIAEDEITVSFKNPEETNYVVVTSLSGKIVFSKSFKDVAEARIASPRIKGVYIISVIDSKQITSEKFIK